MCLKAVLRKILAFVAVLGELVYLLLSVGFHIPFAWYLKQQSGGAQSQRIEWIGGLWTYCFSNLGLDKQEWHCNEVTEKIADLLQHEWGAYQSMKVLVGLSEVAAVALCVFFYIHLCIKSWKFGVVTIILTAFQFVATMISSSLAQSTFSEAFGQETEAAMSLYLIWLCWLCSLCNLGLAIAICVVAYLDK